jgi:carbon storage regulator
LRIQEQANIFSLASDRQLKIARAARLANQKLGVLQMLSLSRKVGESIIISDNIIVTVIGTSGESVKLGISAPRSIPIFRQEVYAQIKADRDAAENNQAGDSKS